MDEDNLNEAQMHSINSLPVFHFNKSKYKQKPAMKTKIVSCVHESNLFYAVLKTDLIWNLGVLVLHHQGWHYIAAKVQCAAQHTRGSHNKEPGLAWSNGL